MVVAGEVGASHWKRGRCGCIMASSKSTHRIANYFALDRETTDPALKTVSISGLLSCHLFIVADRHAKDTEAEVSVLSPTRA